MSEVAEFREAHVRLYPTTVRFPLWARPAAVRTALANLRVGDASVRRLSETFSLRGLMKPPYRPDLRPALDPSEVLPSLRGIAPADGAEIVEWMQIAAAENAVMQARVAEYNTLGSQVVGNSGDPYVPGVVVEDVQYLSEAAAIVASRGYGVARTPRGDFSVPRLGKAVGAFRDLLSWGSISWLGSVQWTGSLLKWKDLAQTPAQQTVGFYMDYAGNVAPIFVVQLPPRPALSVVARIVLSSSDSQTVAASFRDPTDYSRVLATRRVDVPSGTGEVSFTLSAFPYVPPLVAEVQPQDRVQTKLERYTVT